jgi:hypothetical protein
MPKTLRSQIRWQANAVTGYESQASERQIAPACSLPGNRGHRDGESRRLAIEHHSHPGNGLGDHSCLHRYSGGFVNFNQYVTAFLLNPFSLRL